METPKLLLPWRDGTLIDHVLQAWSSSRVDQVVVIVRFDDQALRQACDRWPVTIVVPREEPRDMKHSLQIGLRHLQSQCRPAVYDRCFIAPADLPMLSAAIIDRLLETPSDQSTIVAPKFGDRQGHPALLPWPLTDEIFHLADDEGVNRVVARHPKQFVPFAADEAITDIDTPEEYQSALKRDEKS